MISSQETCWTETNNERFDEGYLGGRKTAWKRLFRYGIFHCMMKIGLVSGVSVQPNGCTGTFLLSGRDNACNVV